MKIIAVTTAILVATSFVASAQSPNVRQPDRQEEIAKAPTKLEPHQRLSIGPGGVMDLAPYGARFERTIKMLEAESAMPDWGWEDGCGHDETNGNLTHNW